MNTIAHTVGAIGVGAQAAKIFGSKTYLLGLPTESVIAGVMTLAILILSEIIPKTLGANMWETFAPFTVKSIKLLLIVLAPFVWLSQLITKNFKRDKDKSIFSRADIAAIAHASEESGVLHKSESTIIKNLLRFQEVKVKDIMTPRPVIVKAAENMTLMDFHLKHQPLRFSRIPIFSESSDDISGFVLKDDILQNLVEGRDETLLKTIKRDVLAVLNSMPLPALFERLTTERAHIAIVVNEYGTLVGLVTMEDLVETLLGLEIVDEFDEEVDLQKYARDKWKARAKEFGLLEEESD